MVELDEKLDLTSVRTLIRSVSLLARHLKLTPNAIYRWITVNRIPGSHVVRVCNFYGIEITEILPLTGSDKNNEVTLKLKPRSVLKSLMDVFQGTITLDQAVTITGSSKISLTLILTHWGDELPTLYTTLEQLDQKRIDLDEACRRLRVEKYTLHGIRRKYGYAPGALTRTRPEPTLPARRNRSREMALRCIAGKITVKDAARESGVSERTLFRAVEALTTHKLNELNAWPRVFREALVGEIEGEAQPIVSEWLEFANSQRLFVNRSPKYPPKPLDWCNLPLKRLLVGVLLREDTLDEIADSREADPGILSTLFSGDLEPLMITFEQVELLPLTHKLAMAELLLAMMDRKVTK
jgi:transposase-like protein